MQPLAIGSIGQWLIKPILAYLIALTFVPLLHLPPAVGTGLILVTAPEGLPASSHQSQPVVKYTHLAHTIYSWQACCRIHIA